MGQRREWARQRRQLEAFEAEQDRHAERPRAGSPVMIGQVFNNGSIPTTVPGRFAVHPMRVSFAEQEASSLAFNAVTGTAFFNVIGTQVPQVNDILIGHLVGSRWVAKKGRGAANTCSPCATSTTSGTETVTWDLQALHAAVSQLQGAVQQCWGTHYNSFGGQYTAWQSCFGPPPAGCVDNQGTPCLVCGEADCRVTSLFIPPTTFNLAPLPSPQVGFCSQVVQLFAIYLDMTRWLAGDPIDCCDGAFPFGSGYYVGFAQVWKTCNGSGTTYTCYVTTVWGGNNPSPTPPTAVTSGAADSFLFPADGSSGVLSCSPLHLSASHSTSYAFCGLSGATATDTITVTA